LAQPRVPEDLYSASVEYSCTDKLSFDLNGQYVGKRYDLDYLANPMLPPVQVSLSSYALVNLAVQYKICPTYKLFARVDNLTNADYETIYSYRTAGRGIYGGVTAEL
jgi:vitamin B12 transporter